MSAVSDVSELLREVPIFQGLDEAQRAQLAEEIEPVTFAEGSTVFHYGDPGDCLYVIQSGEAEVYTEDHSGRRITLGVIGSKAVFGELSLFDNGPRTASVLAKSTLTAIRLDRSHLQQFLLTSPTAAWEMLTLMGRYMRENAEHLRRSTTQNANQVVDEDVSFMHHVAEWITEFSGSIPFLVIHFLLFTWWVLANLSLLPGPVFDPYPFGLLSVVVSVEAVVLSVFVLMSQNRQRRLDRIRSDIEYEVNLKAEMEVSHLHTRIDHWNSRFLMELREIKKLLQS
jgi:CRP/FNR family transcriptional regulator, cyclic AMP receptor protein